MESSTSIVNNYVVDEYSDSEESHSENANSQNNDKEEQKFPTPKATKVEEQDDKPQKTSFVGSEALSTLFQKIDKNMDSLLNPEKEPEESDIQ